MTDHHLVSPGPGPQGPRLKQKDPAGKLQAPSLTVTEG